MYPERGRQSAVTNARELVVPFGRSAYIVRYALLTKADEVIILRVWHGREQRE
jgi:plasmid stabilization system protein ParE